jgi:hypothetical protein
MFLCIFMERDCVNGYYSFNTISISIRAHTRTISNISRKKLIFPLLELKLSAVQLR